MSDSSMPTLMDWLGTLILNKKVRPLILTLPLTPSFQLLHLLFLQNILSNTCARDMKLGTHLVTLGLSIKTVFDKNWFDLYMYSIISLARDLNLGTHFRGVITYTDFWEKNLFDLNLYISANTEDRYLKLCTQLWGVDWNIFEGIFFFNLNFKSKHICIGACFN